MITNSVKNNKSDRSPHLLLSMSDEMCFEVGALSESLVAVLAHVWAVSSVYSHVSSQIEVQRKPLTTTFERALNQTKIKIEEIKHGQHTNEKCQ